MTVGSAAGRRRTDALLGVPAASLDEGVEDHRVALVRDPDSPRLVLGQDTGAGIRGQRMDVYFGEDDVALAAAQAMTVQGDAWVLMPK